jgi:hypothetical protein
MDDNLADIGESPIRVILYGSQFASCDDGDALGMMASGPKPLELLAMRLFQAGFDPERPLILFRGGERVGKTSVGVAAGVIDG